jgi:hypothetical protein
MSPLPDTPELRAIAKNIIWFKEPEAALQNPVHFLTYLLTYGTHEQVKSVRKHLTDSDLLYVLDHAVPGVMDARSWSYWNMMLNRYPPPPMPQRWF